jgi:hypothetical protein
VTRLRSGRREFDSRQGQGRDFFFSSPSRPDRLWGTLSLLSSGYREILHWGGGKRPRREAKHSRPSRVEVKNEWGYTSTPKYVSMAWQLVKHRDKFTFTFRARIQSNGILKVSFRIGNVLRLTNNDGRKVYGLKNTPHPVMYTSGRRDDAIKLNDVKYLRLYHPLLFC